MSLRRYQEYESGTREFNPTLDTLIALAKVLETDPGELLARHTPEEAKASLRKDKRRVFKGSQT